MTDRVIRPLRPDRLPVWADERADGAREASIVPGLVVACCLAGFGIVGLLALIASLL